jgi:hypothetical protein
MEKDYVELCCLINAWDLCDKDHRERSRAEFRQFMVAMVDKGPEHLIGTWRMYLKTHQLEDRNLTSYNLPI